MSGRRERSATHAAVPVRSRRKLLAGVTMFAMAATSVAIGLVSASPASAAPITANVQLTSTGLADSKNPVGGSIVGIRPGDSVNFTTAAVPTAGLDKLGLGSLVNGLLGSVVGYQSSADFGKLPGGKDNTTVKAKPAVKLTFPKAGVYNFKWTVQKVVVGVLGNKSILSLDLNGNQLEKAGVKLNANNEYVGQVVVSNNPPKGGLSIQLPKIEVQPSIPIVGKLPKVTIPGVQAPTISIPSLGTLIPKLPKLPKLTNPIKGASSAPAPKAATPTIAPYQMPGVSVPEQVVPAGTGGQAYGGSSGDFNSGDFANVLPKNSITASKAGSDKTSDTKDANGAAAPASNVGNTVELAADSGTPSSQLPVILAVLAIIALALVAGTYARLFLLKSPGK